MSNLPLKKTAMLLTLVNFSKGLISSTVAALFSKSILMAHAFFSKGTGRTELKKVEVALFRQSVMSMKVNGRKGNVKAREFTCMDPVATDSGTRVTS